MARVCVMGGGPAGSIFAIRMAELGHQVDVIEAAAFPRPHLGESLSRGVQVLLQSVSAAGALDGALPVRKVEVAWDGPALIRNDEREAGLLVDRGYFDGALLDRARRLGVRVHQSARIVDRKQTENGWRLAVAAAAGKEILQVDFLADARGRAGAAAWRRDTTGPATLALHAYWKGAALPAHPVIRAGDAAWYWAVPLPDGTCHLQVFVDAKEFGALPKATLEARYLELLGPSGFKTGACQSPVQATDATPSVALNAATPSSIALGETALALDPLSSSGVQKAIQTALAGAIVANTLVKSRASAAAAMAFYATTLGEASARHRKWAMSYYAEAARARPDVFWRRRAGPTADEASRRPVVAADAASVASHRVELSRDLVIEDLPCIDGEFVTLKKALRHPGLAAPVAYLGNQPLAPLLSELNSSATLVEIAQGWSHRMPFKSALSIAIWLRNNGVLVEARP
ncbi:NAD(P)/FAD-dependent oxidoreductase [Aestuariivirga sp. YIM B02566]|uniref:Tryptophan 7-halogenase n=1 Tax=Taklimakanibacter albus TaxID=2800327 RepID=A0ACC5RCN0_9HYPH|nr:tryptophan 7-halogenase [Aestuariivirga sp. YIM B02566]MBK1870377.1 tryptophan 7-halogenase [Aestuariivirga sp. YIM B02566]